MMRIASEQVRRLSAVADRAQLRRLDDWLARNLDGWSGTAPGLRAGALAEGREAARRSGFEQEHDLALYLWLTGALGAAAPDFLASGPALRVAEWEAPNRGAALRELYRLAGFDIGAVAARLS